MSGYASGSNPTAYSRITGKILKRIRAIEREPGRFLIARPERTILTVREKNISGECVSTRLVGASTFRGRDNLQNTRSASGRSLRYLRPPDCAMAIRLATVGLLGDGFITPCFSGRGKRCVTAANRRLKRHRSHDSDDFGEGTPWLFNPLYLPWPDGAIRLGRPRKGTQPMLDPLDIFIKMEDGTYVWKAAADSFEVAKSTVQRLATTSPGEYMIFSQTTGNKIVVKDGLPQPGAAS